MPADIVAEVDALVAALGAELESLKTQTGAARAGDVEGFTATLGTAASTQAAFEAAAEELGATAAASRRRPVPDGSVSPGPAAADRMSIP